MGYKYGFKDKETRNKYMKAYYYAKHNLLKAQLVGRLGGKCNFCGDTENLEFDHIDPETKSFKISLFFSKSKESLENELAKCQLLCHDCHMNKTIVERGQIPARGTHGTLTAYKYCKCEICVKVNSDYNKAYRLRRYS